MMHFPFRKVKKKISKRSVKVSEVGPCVFFMVVLPVLGLVLGSGVDVLTEATPWAASWHSPGLIRCQRV